MEKSSGILAYRKREGTNEIEFLLCSPSGPYWKRRKLFCFPKGHIESSDESDKLAALREFYEETSFNLVEEIDNVIDYKIIKQNPKKTVHVFLYHDKNQSIDVNKLRCLFQTEIEFPKKSNNFIKIDEVDSYTWMTYDEILNSEHIKVYDNTYKEISSINI